MALVRIKKILPHCRLTWGAPVISRDPCPFGNSETSILIVLCQAMWHKWSDRVDSVQLFDQGVQVGKVVLISEDR